MSTPVRHAVCVSVYALCGHARPMSWFDDEPASSLQLTGEQLSGHSPKQRLGVRHVCSQFAGSPPPSSEASCSRR